MAFNNNVCCLFVCVCVCVCVCVYVHVRVQVHASECAWVDVLFQFYSIIMYWLIAHLQSTSLFIFMLGHLIWAFQKIKIKNTKNVIKVETLMYLHITHVIVGLSFIL